MAEEKKTQLVPRDLAVSKLRVGEDELAVFSMALGSVAVVRGLTDAQRDVLKRIVDGESNAEIAEGRGTSARTVANQVAEIFRHFDVRSRAALVHKLLSGDEAAGEEA